MLLSHSYGRHNKTKAKVVEDLSHARKDRNKLKEKEMLMKKREINFQILYKDITGRGW